MKLANLGSRATILTPHGSIDVESASGGRFPSHPDAAVTRVAEIRDWLATTRPPADPKATLAALAADPARLGPPVTHPSQIFAVGLNYLDHSAETGLIVPKSPLVFTKFPSSLAGPGADSHHP